MATTETTKTRAPRKAATDFGRALAGCVAAVHQEKLSIMVAKLIGEPESDKAHSAIKNMIRKAGQNEGVVSVRSKPLVEAVLETVKKLDADLTAKCDSLKLQFQYKEISSENREPGQNWIVKLKAGEDVRIQDGPEGTGMYRLEFVGPCAEAEVETEVEVEA